MRCYLKYKFSQVKYTFSREFSFSLDSSIRTHNLFELAYDLRVISNAIFMLS